MPLIKEDPGIGAEVKSYEDLVVGLPKDNLTIVSLARKLAGELKREPVPSTSSALDAERSSLKQVVRYEPARLNRLWTVGITKHHGVETRAHLFAMADGLLQTLCGCGPSTLLERCPPPSFSMIMGAKPQPSRLPIASTAESRLWPPISLSMAGPGKMTPLGCSSR